ncbi:HAD family acid phosphatase, partial [Klebsiella pneumoniae]|uniref:HAD family acid phosphatase n=1 Tax=Klebsiella pneumoniae TaxID=573 RepID=UPI001E3E6B5F
MRIISSLIIASFIALSSSSFAEPANLQLVKKHLIQYHDSGAYAREIASKIKVGENYLKRRIAENNKQKVPDKLAIVLDIDETSLSNYADMVKLNFGGTLTEINQDINTGQD